MRSDRTQAPYYSIIQVDGPSQVPSESNMGHTISLDNYTTLPGKSGITHAISPCIALGTVEARAAVGLIEKL